MKRIGKGFMLTLTALVLATLLTLAATAQTYGGIYDKTVRLHVLADSDEPAAQALKLKVRDALIVYLENALSGCAERAQAEERIIDRIPQMEELARQTLSKEGCTLPVKITLEREDYPTREYEGFSFPAGCYTSLRVFIGRGQGQNWWCVVYPPLCLNASLANEHLQQGYSEEEQALLTQKERGYKLRFAILELGAYLKELFS